MRSALIPLLDEKLGEPVGAVLGAGEDQRLLDLPGLEQVHAAGRA